MRLIVAMLCLVASASGSAPASTPGWTDASPMTYSRRQHTMTLLLDGRVLVAGGDGRSSAGVYGFLDTAEIYDPATNTWRSTNPMTVHRVGATAVRLPDGRVLMIGGGGATSESATTAEIFDPVTETWRRTTPPSRRRDGDPAVLLPDGRVLMVGGCCDHLPTGGYVTVRTAEVFDPRTERWTEVAPMIAQRAGPSITLMRDGKVFVFGGQTYGRTVEPTDDGAEVYGPAADVWAKAGPAYDGEMSQGHTASLLADGRVLVVGGCCIRRPLPTPCVLSCMTFIGQPRTYDATARRWLPTSPAVEPRYSHQTVVLRDGRALVLGGITRTANLLEDASRTTELFTPSTGLWSAGPSMSLRRSGAKAVLLLDGRVLVAGGVTCDCATMTSRAEIFQP